MRLIQVKLYSKDTCHLIILYNIRFQNIIYWTYTIVTYYYCGIYIPTILNVCI
jgi:hypothetical protein